MELGGAGLGWLGGTGCGSVRLDKCMWLKLLGIVGLELWRCAEEGQLACFAIRCFGGWLYAAAAAGPVVRFMAQHTS